MFRRPCIVSDLLWVSSTSINHHIETTYLLKFNMRAPKHFAPKNLLFVSSLNFPILIFPEVKFTHNNLFVVSCMVSTDFRVFFLLDKKSLLPQVQILSARTSWSCRVSEYSWIQRKYDSAVKMPACGFWRYLCMQHLFPNFQHLKNAHALKARQERLRIKTYC